MTGVDQVAPSSKSDGGRVRIGLYARVSTADQHAEIQIHALEQYARARSAGIVGPYIDRGVSGAKDRRPALDQLLSDARRRRIDAVACTKLDRLARSVRHLTSLAEELEGLGVDLVVLDQAIDTSTSAGRLLFGVLACIAQFERDLIRDRTRAGVAAARRRGKKLGRPRVPVPMAKVGLLLDRRLSISAIARELQISRATLQRAMQRERNRSARSGCSSSAMSGEMPKGPSGR